MLGSAVIVFRETLEAALIIGIIALATRGLRQRTVWLVSGVLAGIAGSVAVASLTSQIGAWAEGSGQELFNAAVLAVAISMLAWHNIWMTRHGIKMAGDARQLGQAVAHGRREISALAVVVALTVLREGAETVLFLYGLFSGGGESLATVFSGGALGMLTGALAGYGLYSGLLRIPARWLFRATGGLILLLAAAMASALARNLVQADVLPGLSSPLWDTSSVLADSALTARVLHTLIGYEAMPSGMQVLFYFLTLAVILGAMRLAHTNSSSSITV